MKICRLLLEKVEEEAAAAGVEVLGVAEDEVDHRPNAFAPTVV